MKPKRASRDEEAGGPGLALLPSVTPNIGRTTPLPPFKFPVSDFSTKQKRQKPNKEIQRPQYTTLQLQMEEEIKKGVAMPDRALKVTRVINVLR